MPSPVTQGGAAWGGSALLHSISSSLRSRTPRAVDKPTIRIPMPTDLMGIIRSSFNEASRQPEGWWHSPTETSPLCRDVALPSTAVLTLWLCLRHLCWPPFLCTPTSFSLEDSIPGSHFITPATLPKAVSWVQKTSLPSEMSEQCSELKKSPNCPL